MRSRTRRSRFRNSKLGGASEGVSRRGRNPGMKRWGREDRVARPLSTRQGADGSATGHDKGIQDTKRHRRPVLEDNGGLRRERVTKVTRLTRETNPDAACHMSRVTGHPLSISRSEQRSINTCFASTHRCKKTSQLSWHLKRQRTNRCKRN